MSARRLAAAGVALAVAALWAGPLAAQPAPPSSPAPAPPPAAAPSGAPITITADHVEYDSTTGVVVADGHVRATQADQTITADHLQGNLKTETIEASGHVVLMQGRQQATGDFLRYNYRTRAGHIEQTVTQYGPYHVSSRSLDTSATQGQAYNTTITPCDPAHPAFAVRAQRAVIVPDDYIILYNASILVAGVAVLTVPQYTVHLHGRRVGIATGYNNLDGPWVEYRDAVILSGDLTDYYRIRYGTIAGFSGENILVLQGPDHAWDLDVGRTEVYDANGNLFYVDQAVVDLNYSPHPVPGLPLAYTLQAHGGDIRETQTGVATSRLEGRVDVTTDAFRITQEMTLSAAGWAQEDIYGTGRQRSITGATAALVQPISLSETLSLTYYYQTVVGTTPFLFDVQSPGTTVAFTYSYISLNPDALLQSGTATFTYDFIALQTTATPSIVLRVTPEFSLGVTGTYNFFQQQWTEVDYSVTGHCDCLQVNVVLKTFPPLGAQGNQLFLLLSLTNVPDAAASVRLY